MGFEQYYGQRVKSGVPKASIWKGGQIYLNNTLLNTFNLSSTAFVHLFYDKDKSRIGFRPGSKSAEPGAIKLLVRSGGGLLFARGFLNHFGIKYSQAQRFDAHYNEKENLYILEPEK
ncbi:MAG: hypothetical protein L6425_04800 [Candidatus Aminicenantes bacterium]|nr:hypothetical protein [Candidatus Aminicenantes bacterium]